MRSNRCRNLTDYADVELSYGEYDAAMAVLGRIPERDVHATTYGTLREVRRELVHLEKDDGKQVRRGKILNRNVRHVQSLLNIHDPFMAPVIRDTRLFGELGPDDLFVRASNGDAEAWNALFQAM